MSNGKRQASPTKGTSYPALDATEAEATRGVAGRGLLTDPRPAETLETIYDEQADLVLGCREQDSLNDLTAAVDVLERLPPADAGDQPTIVFDRHTLKRLIIVGGYLATFQNRTPCLLRLAALLDKSLSRHLFVHYPREFFGIVELLVRIGDEIIARTRKPYSTFASLQQNPKLDPRVLKIDPLPRYPFWQDLIDVRDGRAMIRNPRPRPEERFKVEDEQSWQETLDEIERNLEATRVDLSIAAAQRGDAPLINGHLKNLRELKYSHIEQQTRARFPPLWRDTPVAEDVDLILYNSVYSVTLDKNGNPKRIPGITPYALLIPQPGDNLIRQMQPPGLYLSVTQLARYQFAVNGLKVQNLLYSGITGFTETENAFKFIHKLQERLQAYIKNQSMKAIAVIIVPEAFVSADLSIGAVKRRMPDLIAALTRHALVELLKRAKNALENYEEVLKNTTKQVIQGIVEDKIEDWAREWLIKKIGKKIIPGLNLISAISDLIDDAEAEMIRAMIACVIMATKSRRPDDLTISSKILADIAMDKVQEAVIKELVKRGGKQVSKWRQAVEKGKAAAQQPSPSEAEATTAEQPPVIESAKTPTSADVPTKGTSPGEAKPLTQKEVAEQLRMAQQVQRQLQQQQTTKPSEVNPVGDKSTTAKSVDQKGTEPRAEKTATTPEAARPRREETAEARRRDETADDEATDTKATDRKATTDNHTDAKSTHAKDVGNRKTDPPARPDPKEPPLPPSNMPWRERWKFYDKHRDEYPSHIQQMLDRVQRRTAKQQRQVDLAIREHHARQLSEHWGIPVKTTQRIPMKRPEKPPLPRKSMTWQKRLKFYDRHRDDYPPHVQEMLDNPANRTEEGAKQVDKAIREHHARQPREETSGGDWEKTNIAARTGERPALSATSTTKDGAVVQIDDFDPQRGVAIEYKASLDVKGKDPQVADREIKERMERHAQFAEERNLKAYEWVAHSQDSYEKMTNALADLKGAAQKIPDKGLREKMLERYKKISIVRDPILDK
jgi:phage baseplate assembly protein W/predicted DNA-binding protein YlxM (UPF0122 family)